MGTMDIARAGLWFVAAAPAVVACGSAGARDDASAVAPDVEVLGRTGGAVSAASVTSVNGTYTGCLQRSGSWSARVSGSAPLAHAALSVVKDDVACTLTLTELVGDSTYVASPPITLAASYPSTGSSFAVGGGSMEFTANAKVDATTFAGDFTMTVRLSDDVSTSDGGSLTATYALVQSSVSASIVPASDYALSLTAGTALTVQMNAAGVVQSVAGSATLTDGTLTGTSYVVDQGTLGASPSYLQVATAYLAGTVRAISGANPTVAASSFGLAGQNLSTPVVRTIIVSRTLTGVTSYQLFRVTFKAS